MSEERYFCEYCGYDSTNRQQCSHCGRAIENLFTEPPGFRLPAWGRLTIRAYEPDKAEALWKDLSVIWADLETGLERWLDSQLEKFETATDSVELYCSSWHGYRIKELMGSRVTIEFQELPKEQIPYLPVPPRPAHWRQPYVPRGKRKDTL
jgi:hypothetical protein